MRNIDIEQNNGAGSVPGQVNASDGLPTASSPKLAVFGGSFDPIHIGHLFLAGEIVRSGRADEVLFVPAHRPPHKTGHMLSASEHRYAMLKAALAPFPEFTLSDIELARTEGPSYTIETLELLSEVFPGHELLFLMGTDSLRDLHSWFRATELAQRWSFLIYPRADEPAPSFATLAGHFGNRNARKLLNSVLEMPTVPIRATDIRANVTAGRNVAGCVPESVLEYIREKRLYGCAWRKKQP